MGLSTEDVEKIVKKQQDELEKDYVFCETCKFAVAKEAAHEVKGTYDGGFHLYGSCSRDYIYFYCTAHAPEYDEIYEWSEGKLYYKNIPAKRIEVKIKNK